MSILTLGIDIGSTACKCVVLEDGTRICSRAVVPLGTGTKGSAQVYEQALEEAGLTEQDLALRAATGYGRFNFARADVQRSELNCHAAGIHLLLPEVRRVIDIGGQDIKVLSLTDTGSLNNFVMNDKCAAGTGRFLNVMAQVLNVKTEELGEIDEQAQQVVSISNTCTVFAESEVISKLSADVAIPDLVAGIHASVAKRVAALALRIGIVPPVAISGGVALNKGVVRALERELNTGILVHEDCQFAGAIGAAVFAYRKAANAGVKNR